MLEKLKCQQRCLLSESLTFIPLYELGMHSAPAFVQQYKFSKRCTLTSLTLEAHICELSPVTDRHSWLCAKRMMSLVFFTS
jgi:hypothetical protein